MKGDPGEWMRFCLVHVLILTMVLEATPLLTAGDGRSSLNSGEGGTDPAWAMYGGGPERRWASDIGIVMDNRYKVEWSHRMRLPYDNGSVSYSGGMAVSSNGTIYVTDGEGRMRAISPEGELLWVFNGTDRCAHHTNPAIGLDGTIYFTGRSDVLFAVHPNGTLNWTRTYDAWIQSDSPPILVPWGRIYLGLGSNKLLCLFMNGSIDWSVPVEGCLYTAPAFDQDGTAYLNTAHGTVCAVSREGELLWEHYLGAYAYGSVSVSPTGEVIASNNDGVVYSFSRDGKQNWKRDVGSDVVTAYACSEDGTIYGCAGGFLLAISRDGLSLWSRPLQFNTAAAIVEGSGNILVADDVLKCFDPDGFLIWSAPGSHGVRGVPIPVTNGTVVCHTYETVLMFRNVPYPEKIATDVPLAVEDELYVLDLNVTGTDTGGSKWRLVSRPPWLSMMSETGTLSGIPDNGEVGTWDVVVDYTDDFGFVLEWRFEITVVNSLPRILNDGIPEATEDVPYSVKFNSDEWNVGTIAWSLETDSEWLEMDPYTGTLSGTPEDADVGRYALNVTVNDGNGGEDRRTFVLTVGNVPARVWTDDISSAVERIPYDAQLITDDPVGKWVMVKGPSWLSLGERSGRLTGTPFNTDVGEHDLQIDAIDLHGDVCVTNLSIEVHNRDPSIIGEPATSVGEGEPYYADLDSDEDGYGNITWSILSGPDWLFVDRETGVLSGTPGHLDVGSTRVRVIVTDGNSGSEDLYFWLQVLDTHPSPRITTEDREFTVHEGEEFGLQMEVWGEGPFSWSLDGDDSLSIDNGTGYIHGEFADPGNYHFEVEVRDAYGDPDSIMIHIDVMRRPPRSDQWKIPALVAVNFLLFLFGLPAVLWLLLRNRENK